jgi:hypothetical protein
MLKRFKFFDNNIRTIRGERRTVQGRRRYSSFSYYVAGEEKNYVFIWFGDDIRRNEYRLGIYQGCIKDFGDAYDNMIIEDNEILYLFPTIESIEIIRTEEQVPQNFHYNFIDSYEIVTIFFKIYTNDTI